MSEGSRHADLSESLDFSLGDAASYLLDTCGDERGVDAMIDNRQHCWTDSQWENPISRSAS